MSKMSPSLKKHLAKVLDRSALNAPTHLDINLSSPWKEDDRNWFAAHPRRAFRLRRLMLKGAASTLGAKDLTLLCSTAQTMDVAAETERTVLLLIST